MTGGLDVTIDAKPKTAIDYRPCRYGASRLVFRGPPRALDGPYVATLGGSETFGKFVAHPYADLLEARLGEPVVNLGVMQAGLTLFLDDPGVLPVASGARMTVVQVLGAHNMSNRFYSVHRRRNDRFLKAAAPLRMLYPDLDFTEFHFTGHLMQCLEKGAPEAFEAVVEELKTAWVHRMKALLSAIRGERVLLWISDRRPEDTTDTTGDTDPLFVDRAMVEAVLPDTSGLIEVVASPEAREEGLDARSFLPGEEAAARALPGPLFHREVADALGRAIAQPSPIGEPAQTPAPPFRRTGKA